MQNNNVFECINITNVVNQLHLKKTATKGDTIYAICPFCQNSSENNGNLKINTIKNVYVCKKCEQSGSAIDLYANVKYIPTKDAFKRLLKETPVLDNMPYTYNNPVKDEFYRDIVYRSFLELHSLSEAHIKKLEGMNFNQKYMEENLFKTIENNAYKRKNICKKLQEQGLKLDGIPGFFQDNKFQWDYKAHEGIFIPVVLENKIQGLRILLDKEYRLDTENIWFSSNNEYNGTKASNWPMILKDKNTNWLGMYNAKEKTSIIIATEMILAHKLFNNTNKTVIGIPNNIDKDFILTIAKSMNVSEVFLYVDKYTILHTACQVVSNIIQALEEKSIKVDFRIALTENDIGSDLKEEFKENKKVA